MKSNVCPVRFGLMLLLLGLCAVALADTVYLDSGGIIEGTIIEEDDDHVIIKCKYGEVTISRENIDYIERGDNKEIFNRKLKELKPDDIEAHFELGAWAASVGLTEESTKQYEYVVKLDPDHEQARFALGYRKLNDKWVTEEEYYTAQGYVKYLNRWYPRDEAEKLKAGFVRWRGNWVTKKELSEIKAEERRRRAEQPKVKEKEKAYYAFIISGMGKGEGYMDKWCNDYYNVLKEIYGYPDQAIFRLSFDGTKDGELFDGKSTVTNIRNVFEHLANIMEEDDHLFIYISAHGIINPKDKDFVNQMPGGHITGTMYAEWLNQLPSQKIIWMSDSCYGGGVIPKISRPGRVIITAVNSRQKYYYNNVKWDDVIIAALRGEADKNKDGRVSMKEAYDAGFERASKMRAYTLLDDNGDGEGHHGADTIVEGDGEVASKRYLGNEGKKLELQSSDIEKLTKNNEKLVLE